MAGFIKEELCTTSPLVPTDFRHALCIGETGCGKTSSFILPNIEQRLALEHGMLIIDFKGSLHSKVKVLADEANRLEDVIEVGMPWGDKIDIFKDISRSTFINTLDNLTSDDKDDFWTRSALVVAGNIYDTLALVLNLKELAQQYFVLKFEYCLSTMYLNKILSSPQELKAFLEECRNIILTFSVGNLVKMVQDGMNEHRAQLIRQFSKELNASAKKLANFYNDIDQNSPHSGSGGVFFALRGIISNFSNSGLNGKFGLKSLLEEGKIVILRSDTYDNKLTQSIMNILYTQLLKRDNQRGITLFIDEFQRTISIKNIPFIDVFREMKVELIAAMQNITQLENVLGESVSDEFLGNVLHNYEYANHKENTLLNFQYKHKNNKYLAPAYFYEDTDLFSAQLTWQKLQNQPLANDWIYHKSEGHKKVIVLNIKTQEQRPFFLLEKEDKQLTKQFRNIVIANS